MLVVVLNVSTILGKAGIYKSIANGTNALKNTIKHIKLLSPKYFCLIIFFPLYSFIPP